MEYEDLPAVFDLLERVKAGAPVVHENPGAYEGAPAERPHPNVQSVLRFKLGDVEAGFREADRIFEHTFRTQLAHQGYLEPHAGVVAIDEDGRVQVWASNKMPYRLKELLSHALQLPAGADPGQPDADRRRLRRQGLADGSAARLPPGSRDRAGRSRWSCATPRS